MFAWECAILELVSNENYANFWGNITETYLNLAVIAAMDIEVDVVVVGAGPAGLMLANWMSRTGIKTRIFDKRGTKVVCCHPSSHHAKICDPELIKITGVQWTSGWHAIAYVGNL